MRSVRQRAVTIAGILGAILLPGTSPAITQESPPAASRNTCFYVAQFRSWKAPDAKTIYIRVELHRIFRLDLAGECSLLLRPDSHLIMNVRGPDTICRPLDWDLKVAESFPGIPEPCIVKTMTELTPAQAAAIPPHFRP